MSLLDLLKEHNNHTDLYELFKNNYKNEDFEILKQRKDAKDNFNELKKETNEADKKLKELKKLELEQNKEVKNYEDETKKQLETMNESRQGNYKRSRNSRSMEMMDSLIEKQHNIEKQEQKQEQQSKTLKQKEDELAEKLINIKKEEESTEINERNIINYYINYNNSTNDENKLKIFRTAYYFGKNIYELLSNYYNDLDVSFSLKKKFDELEPIKIKLFTTMNYKSMIISKIISEGIKNGSQLQE